MKKLQHILAITLFSMGLFAFQIDDAKDTDTLSQNFEQEYDCCGHSNENDDI